MELFDHMAIYKSDSGNRELVSLTVWLFIKAERVPSERLVDRVAIYKSGTGTE